MDGFCRGKSVDLVERYFRRSRVEEGGPAKTLCKGPKDMNLLPLQF